MTKIQLYSEKTPLLRCSISTIISLFLVFLVFICKNGAQLHRMIIDAEFSLQSAYHNSRRNNKRQSWSQIREI